MQHLLQIIQFAGEGEPGMQVRALSIGQAELESLLSLPSFQQYHGLKRRSFIMIPLAGQRGNQVNYRLVCWLLIKPQLNIKTQGEVPFFTLRASSL